MEAEADTEHLLCDCCEPRNPLVLRPDLGVLPDGSPEFALCVLHQPDPTVYRNRGDGVYEQIPQLSLGPTGDLLDEDGQVVASVGGDGFQRLSTIDDDDDDAPSSGTGGGGDEVDPDAISRPRVSHHVDLSEDDFYLGVRHKIRCGIRPPIHPRWLCCSLVTYHRYAPSSRLASRGASTPSMLAFISRRTP